MSQVWPMPEKTCKADGTPRRVGIEFEVQGIAVDMLARITALTLGGEAQAVSEAEYSIEVPGHGRYRAEIDFARLKQMARQRQEAGNDDKTSVLDDITYDLLNVASALVVPCEVVTPPLDMQAAPEPMEKLTDAIRSAGGKGTGHSPFYAFGLHLNVEPHDLEAATILAHMKAFVCLFDWLVWKEDVDLMRRATPYIQRYPAEYELHLANPDYWPDWDGLIEDYLEFNPTRNRALDMLPMMSEIDDAAVREIVDDDRVLARPTFHYRLANCSIDEPEWSIADPWSRWVRIEQLAADRDALNDCCREYLSDRDRPMSDLDTAWREKVTEWLTTS